MAHTASMPHPGSEFHAFLYAPIGEDKSGLPLSVLSALARMDLDPWEEAASLAGLPAATATQRVVALFRTLPDQSLSDRDRSTLATRLISLLPRAAGNRIKHSKVSANAGDAIHARLGALFFALFVFALMAAQFVATRLEPPTQGTPPHAASVAAPSQSTPATSGQ